MRALLQQFLSRSVKALKELSPLIGGFARATEVPGPPERLQQLARAFFGSPSRSSSRFSAKDLIAAAAFSPGGSGAPSGEENLAKKLPNLRQLGRSDETMHVKAAMVPPTMVERVPHDS